MVSIVIPAYKASFLQNAIASVLSQTYKDFELIVVNDKSPEDITGIVKSFNDDRIRYYINEQNLGKKSIINNWNKCLSYVRGDYFALLCDDDIYKPTFIEEMVKLAGLFPNCNVYRAGVEIFVRDNSLYDYYPSSPLWESCEDYIWHVFRGYRCQTVSEWFYRTEPIKNLGGYELLPIGWYSDYLSSFKFAINGGIASTSQRLVKFRMSGLNITSQIEKNATEKMYASVLFEEQMYKIIHNSKMNKEMILPLMQKYLCRKRAYMLRKCGFGDLLVFCMQSKKYHINMSMIIKSMILRFYI